MSERVVADETQATVDAAGAVMLAAVPRVTFVVLATRNGEVWGTDNTDIAGRIALLRSALRFTEEQLAMSSRLLEKQGGVH